MSTTEPDAANIDLIPPDPGLINPDLALDAALGPVEETDPDAPQPFGRGWRFDFITEKFVMDGRAPQETYELDSLIVWVEKTLRTARFAHAIYSDGYGIENPFDVIGLQADDETFSAYEEAVTDALLVHDRITAVEGFTFSQDPFDEAVFASFTVVLDAAPPLEAQPIEFSNVPVTS
jgi:hypothetical protein